MERACDNHPHHAGHARLSVRNADTRRVGSRPAGDPLAGRRPLAGRPCQDCDRTRIIRCPRRDGTPVGGVLRRDADCVRPPARSPRYCVPARRLAGALIDPVRRDQNLRRAGMALGRPTAARAVGAANGRNPISIVLPCHRVVGSNGALTGFAGGLEAKRGLLELERRRCRAPAERRTEDQRSQLERAPSRARSVQPWARSAVSAASAHPGANQPLWR